MAREGDAVQPSGVDDGYGVESKPSGTYKGWRGVGLFFLANGLFGAGLFFHAFLYNFYLQGLGHSEGVMGVAAAAISAGGLLGLMPAGFAIDRWGVRPAYLGAAVLAVAGLAAGALVERPLAVYASALVAGAGAAAFRVTMGPALMVLAGPAIRARAFSWNTAILVGSGAGWTAAAGAASVFFLPLVDGDRVAAHRTALLLGAALTALAAVLAPLALRTSSVGGEDAPSPGPPDRARAGAPSVRPMAVPMRLAFVILAVGVFWTAGALGLPFFNIYFQQVHAVRIERIGVILSVGQALTAVAVFASGESAARTGPYRMLVLWMLVFPPATWVLALAGDTSVAMAAYMVQAFVLPAVYPLVDQILLERAERARHGAVSGWRNLAVEASGLIGATVGGYLLQASSFQGLYGVAGALGLGGALLSILALRRLRAGD